MKVYMVAQSISKSKLPSAEARGYKVGTFKSIVMAERIKKYYGNSYHIYEYDNKIKPRKYKKLE